VQQDLDSFGLQHEDEDISPQDLLLSDEHDFFSTAKFENSTKPFFIKIN
jgi:hypothetical protein